MKYQVLIEILYLLLADKKVSAKKIADRFEISQRTVYRYIQELELANIPIIVERGAKGGFYIAETFKMPASFFTEKEYVKLISIIEAFENQFGDDVKAIKDKIKSSSKQTQINLSTNQLIIDGSDWFSSVSHKNKLLTLTKAIDQSVMLEICYHDRNGETSKRVIEPHALALKQGLWYVYAFCHKRNDFRLFKVGRIEYAIEKESFMRRNFDSNNLPFNTWHSRLDVVEFVFEIDQKIKSDIEEWLGLESVSRKRDGRLIVRAKLKDDKATIYKILSYGSMIKVIEPQSVKDDILKLAKEVIDIYS